jgi:hypothetical protein
VLAGSMFGFGPASANKSTTQAMVGIFQTGWKPGYDVGWEAECGYAIDAGDARHNNQLE